MLKSVNIFFRCHNLVALLEVEMTLSYPLVLQCGEEFIAVPISTITNYSSVFKALFLGEEYR